MSRFFFFNFRVLRVFYGRLLCQARLHLSAGIAFDVLDDNGRLSTSPVFLMLVMGLADRADHAVGFASACRKKRSGTAG